MERRTEAQRLNALEHFKTSGILKSCEPYGNGHINDTYSAAYKTDNGEKRYILQAVNTDVFKEPDKLMSNIEKVTAFLREKGCGERETLSLVKTRDGKAYYTDSDNNCWRMYDFIENSICLELPESNEDFYQCAVAFGRFQKFLDDFPVNELYETIPDFHNTPKRFADFIAAVERDALGRAKNVQGEIEFIKARSSFYSVLIDSEKQGLLPLRVSHNDTKSNNVMLDKATRKALCVIDLDTVMPGYSVTDFGDSIRFGASTAAEDEKDLSKVHFSLEKFKTYAAGYLDGCGGMLKNSEIMLLPEGAKMMTIECGMRFLADYLDGDTYFKTAYAEHNLVRCRTQLKLVSEMEENWDEMKNTVEGFCR